MNVQEPAQEQPPQVEKLVDALVQDNLAKYLLDSASANELIRDIAAETGFATRRGPDSLQTRSSPHYEEGRVVDHLVRTAPAQSK
jgi:hypothetical protein